MYPYEFYPSYIQLYIERDVRQIKNLGDLSLFKRFMKLCAGRIGQLLNISSLADDCGVSANTIKAWLSILEESYIIFLLHPHYKNFSKRLIKMPKIYFYDTGLACSLLGLEDEKQLSTHYLRGGLFESFVICELMKEVYNQTRLPHFYFWRDQHGHEIDCIIEKGPSLIPIEIKSALTSSSDFFQGLVYWNKLAEQNPENGFVVYAGQQDQKRSIGNLIGWQHITSILQQ